MAAGAMRLLLMVALLVMAQGGAGGRTGSCISLKLPLLRSTDSLVPSSVLGRLILRGGGDDDEGEGEGEGEAEAEAEAEGEGEDVSDGIMTLEKAVKEVGASLWCRRDRIAFTEKGVYLIKAPSKADLGKWAGQVKLDAAGDPKKSCGASSIAIKEFGEQSEGLAFLLEYIKENADTLDADAD
eukprot:768493-Hanusia_phi.AAC.2